MQQADAIMYFNQQATDAEVTENGQKLWLTLFTHMCEMKKWHRVYLRTETLVEELGVTVCTFYRARQQLAEKGFLNCSNKKSGAYFTLQLGAESLVIDPREDY